jgi:hypothetical protein
MFWDLGMIFVVRLCSKKNVLVYFFDKHIVHASIAVKSRGNPFDEGGEFFEHMPIDKFGVVLQKNINRLSEDGTPSDTSTPPPFLHDGLQTDGG